jgi:hypothetical protein
MKKNLYIRGIDEEVLEDLHILRKKYNAKNWAELLKILVEKEMKEVEKIWSI